MSSQIHRLPWPPDPCISHGVSDSVSLLQNIAGKHCPSVFQSISTALATPKRLQLTARDDLPKKHVISLISAHQKQNKNYMIFNENFRKKIEQKIENFRYKKCLVGKISKCSNFEAFVNFSFGTKAFVQELFEVC